MIPTSLLRFQLDHVRDISAIASWCQLKGSGRWQDFRRAVNEIDEALNPYDIARALAIDCIIDVHLDGDWRWSSPSPCFVRTSGETAMRVVGASDVFELSLRSACSSLTTEESRVTFGSGIQVYKYAAIEKVDFHEIETALSGDFPVVEPRSLLTKLPNLEKLVSSLDEIEPLRSGAIAEMLCFDDASLSFDGVPRTEFKPSAFGFDPGGESILWRTAMDGHLLTKGGRAYAIPAATGRLYVLLAYMRRNGRQLRIDWHASLSEGNLKRVASIPRLPIPLIYRRALRVLGARYPLFKSDRIWTYDVDWQLIQLFASRLGISAKKHEEAWL
jgi:hypothetical protein